MTRRLLLAIAMLLATASALALPTLDEIRERGWLRVAVYRDFPPFSYVKNGEMQGIDVDIARALGKKIGVELQLMPLTAGEDVDSDLRNGVWKGHYLGGGTADLMLHIPYDRQLEQRTPNTVFIAPYYREGLGWFGQNLPASPLLLTQGLIAVENDSLADLYLSALQGGRLRASLRHFPNTPAAAKAWLQGETDYVFGTRSELDWATAGSGHPPAAMAALPGLVKADWEIGMAIKEGQRDLGWAVTDALAELQQQGEIERIFKRHGVRFNPPDPH